MAWLPVRLRPCSAIWKLMPSLYSSGCPSENPHALTVSPFKAFSPQPPKFFKPLMPVKEEHKKRLALEARPLLSQEVNVRLLSTVWHCLEWCSLQRAVVGSRVLDAAWNCACIKPLLRSLSLKHAGLWQEVLIIVATVGFSVAMTFWSFVSFQREGGARKAFWNCNRPLCVPLLIKLMSCLATEYVHAFKTLPVV